MNIPQVNATVTDRNREQTEQILRLLGYQYISKPPWVKSWRNETGDDWFGDNTNGSFTLDQVVGMLGEYNVAWTAEARGQGYWERLAVAEDGAVLEDDCEIVLEADNPHDLTAALDALIKVLEAKP